MNSTNAFDYRGHRFLVEARPNGVTWTGHFALVDVPEQVALGAAAAAQHQWTPLDPVWATRNEAETNAFEAAHATIDALMGAASRNL